MAIWTGKDLRYGFAQGSTFGTAIADSAAFNQLSCDNFTINPDVKVRTPARASGQRYPDITDVSADTKDSIVNASITGEVLKTEIAHLIYSVVQNVTESATTPYQKDFSLPTSSNVTDFGSDEGYFMTFIKRNQEASTSEKVASMVGNSLAFNFADGYLTYNWGLSGFTLTRTSNPSGTWTKASQSKFHIEDINLVQIGDVDMILTDWTLTITPNLVPIRTAGSGTYNGFAISSWEVKNTINVLNTSAARSVQSGMDSGTETHVEIGWGTSGSDGALIFNTRGIIVKADYVEGDTHDLSFELLG